MIFEQLNLWMKALYIKNSEGCQSGRSELPAKELNRKVPWVRIPHLPPTLFGKYIL